jgi:hypothetical protein
MVYCLSIELDHSLFWWHTWQSYSYMITYKTMLYQDLPFCQLRLFALAGSTWPARQKYHVQLYLWYSSIKSWHNLENIKRRGSDLLLVVYVSRIPTPNVLMAYRYRTLQVAFTPQSLGQISLKETEFTSLKTQSDQDLTRSPDCCKK